MVVRIADIGGKEERPVFVPRKKRKANLSNVQLLNDKNTDAVEEPVKESKAGIPETTRLSIPSWRLQKESELQKEHPETQERVPAAPLKWNKKKRSEMTDRDWRIMRHDLQIKCETPIKPLLSWSELGNKQLVIQLSRNFSSPTPVQRAAISLACWGRHDMLALAPTGSGKTIGFVAPLIDLSVHRSLILAPTRELAVQIADVIADYSMKELNVVTIVGGRDFEEQVKQLEKTESHSVIVATPGRLVDFLNQDLVDLQDCEYLVFDEADRMIDMGFEPQISLIMAKLKNKKRQTMMFSATWPKEVQDLSHKFLRSDHIKIEISSANAPSSPKISQSVELINSAEQKLERLVTLTTQAKPPIICFVASKVASESIASQLSSKGVKSQCLHGGLSQSVRDATLGALRNHTIKCLVATDVASRGVDVPGVSLVINFDLPSTVEVYTHRIGRTGRAGGKGTAISFATDGDSNLFPELRRKISSSGCPIPDFLRDKSA